MLKLFSITHMYSFLTIFLQIQNINLRKT